MTGIAASDVSAVLVTRGDVNMAPILDSLHEQGVEDIILWDNSVRENEGVYGRYIGAAEAAYDVILFQDDDLFVPCIAELCDAYEPGVVTINFPAEYPLDIPWMGYGSIFDRGLWREPHQRYLAVFPFDAFFRNVCDAVFSMLTPLKVIHGGVHHRPEAYRPDRTSNQPDWY